MIVQLALPQESHWRAFGFSFAPQRTQAFDGALPVRVVRYVRAAASSVASLRIDGKVQRRWMLEGFDQPGWLARFRSPGINPATLRLVLSVPR